MTPEPGTCQDCRFVEAENRRLRQENRELKTLAKVGLWHDDCRLNRRQAVEIIEKMSIVEGKLVETITELRTQLQESEANRARVESERDALDPRKQMLAVMRGCLG